MIACLLAVGLTAFTLTNVVPNPNSTNKYYNQGLSDVVYDFEKYGENDNIIDSVVYTIPNNFSGLLQYNIVFSSDGGYIDYFNNNNYQQFAETYDVGDNVELLQHLVATRSDFYVSISNPCEQGFGLQQDFERLSMSYSIEVEYDYLIPGYMTENTWYNSVVYTDTYSFSGTQSIGDYVYPILWFIDSLDKDVSTIYDLIHIRTFKLTISSQFKSLYDVSSGFIIDNDYSLEDSQAVYSDNWYDTYVYGVSTEPLPVVDFTSWITTAISSFWNFYIFPGVSIGIIFSTIVALVIIVIILKMFLGD